MKTPNFREILWLFTLTILATNLISAALLNPEGGVIEPGPGEGYATLYVSPASVNLTSPPYYVGDKFSVEIRMFNYSQVASWQVKLVYDKRLLNISSPDDADYASDHIFPSETYYPILTSIEDYNDTHQYVMKMAAAYGAVEYNGTDAGLLKINFTIMAEPAPWEILSCELWLEPVVTWTCDENVEENDEERIDGYYEIAVLKEVEPGPGGGYATIYVFPVFLNLTCPSYYVGDEFTVKVRIFNYSQVACWQVKLVYDKSFFKISSLADAYYAPAADFIFPADSYSYASPSIAYFNATHEYVIMNASTQGMVGHNGTDAGLMVINFTINSAPPKGVTASCVLWLEPTGTYTLDEMGEKNYEERINGYLKVAVEKRAESIPFEVIIAVIIIVAAAAAIIGLLFMRKRKKAYKKR